MNSWKKWRRRKQEEKQLLTRKVEMAKTPELEDERSSRKNKKRKVFEQIEKSDCEEQFEND